MLPELVRIGGFFILTYGVLVALAFLVALWIVGKLARRDKVNPDTAINLGIYCALAGIAGAKLMMFLIDIPYYAAHPKEIFSIESLQAAGVFYGGLIGAIAVGWWYMRREKLPVFRTMDVFAPGIAIGHAIGRLGCFAAGCCYGTECHLPWAVTFRDPKAYERSSTPLGVPLHPTQLYESAAEAIIFAILWSRIQRPHRQGSIMALYLILYGTVRFLVEFLRVHEQANPFGSPLNMSQWISLVLIAVAVVFLWRGRHSALAKAAL